MQIADVIERATTYAKEAVVHREHGTPQDLAGGPAAEDGHGSKMKACGYALSSDFVNRLLSDYPDAQHARVATKRSWNLIRDCFIKAAFDFGGKRQYCRDTQKAIEADVERRLKELDDDGKQKLREFSEAKEQLRHCASTR